MPNKRVSKEEREILIIAELSLLLQEGKIPELTAYRLARKMDMRVSTTLYQVLSDMVAKGRLTARQEVIENRCTRTWYQLAEGTYTLPDKTRVIPMRMGGKIYQEVMF